MATRMQQRRGTAAQWTSSNPVLNAGEMGWESDTNKFKIGDGTNHWADLDYFIDQSSTVNPSFGSSIVFEGATADSYETTLAITDPTADRTITFPDATGTVALTSDITELSQDAIDTALTAGTGITKTYNDNANTLTLAVDTTTIQARVADVSDTEIGYLNGVNSAIQTQLDNKAPAGDLTTHTGASTGVHGVTGSVVGTSDSQTLTNKTLTSPVISGLTLSDGSIVVEGATANNHETTLSFTDPTADRTITFPDETGTVALTANVAALSGAIFTGAVTLAADPASALQAATKQYVDNTASGIIAKPQVLGATTTNIDATYSNGTAGVGATLTHNTNGAFPAEAGGASGWAVGKGILVKNQTNKAQNGRYFISDMGSVSTPYVLTRCTYCDEAGEIPGAYIFVQDGTSAGTGWIQVVADPATFVVGTDDIDVYQFSGSGTITAGTGITVNGNAISINTAATVDLSTAQTLTNKTIDGSNNTISNVAISTAVSGLANGVATLLGTPSSANLASAITDETGSGSLVFGTAPTLTNAVEVNPILRGPEERWSVSGTGASGTVNLDVLTSGVLYSTGNATGNWTLNVRGDGSNTLNDSLATNDSITVVFFATNGGTPYRATGFTIDGSAVTPKWQNGTAPSAGNANSIDIYSYTIVKTGSATFTVFGSQTRFA